MKLNYGLFCYGKQIQQQKIEVSLTFSITFECSASNIYVAMVAPSLRQQIGIGSNFHHLYHLPLKEENCTSNICWVNYNKVWDETKGVLWNTPQPPQKCNQIFTKNCIEFGVLLKFWNKMIVEISNRDSRFDQRSYYLSFCLHCAYRYLFPMQCCPVYFDGV